MWSSQDAKLRAVMAVEELKNYNQTVRRCFRECVWALTSPALTDVELECMDNCYSKVVGFNESVGEMILLETQKKTEVGK